MIEWFTNWAQGIIIAVIIATIIEMILPEGNCKKYIKVVIGVYVLFSIISPVITKVTGKNFNISDDLNLEKFYEEADSKSIYNDLDSNNSNNIKEIYIANLKTDIKSKLNNKGYEVISCNIEIKDNETYEIEKLDLTLEKIKENTEENTETSNSIVNNIKVVNDVNISVAQATENIDNSEKSDNNKRKLTMYEINKLKEYIEETYEIKKEDININ